MAINLPQQTIFGLIKSPLNNVSLKSSKPVCIFLLDLSVKVQILYLYKSYSNFLKDFFLKRMYGDLYFFCKSTAQLQF